MRHRNLKITQPRRRSVKTDPVSASEFRNFKLIYCCEQCSHFAPETTVCTLGYNAKNHLRAENLKSYELTGRMAFCRFLEID